MTADEFAELMSDTDIYRSGYAEAVTDVCKMFDSMHDQYTKALKGDTSDDELRKLELSLVTISAVIYHLDSRLRGVRNER